MAGCAAGLTRKKIMFWGGSNKKCIPQKRLKMIRSLKGIIPPVETNIK